MGRFEQVRDSIRRAYEVSRDTMRTVRERAVPDGAVADLPVTLEQPPFTVERGSTAEGARRAEGAREPEGPAGEAADERSPAPPPIEEAVPRSLRIAAAWSWRLIVVALVGWALLWLTDRFLILVAPLMIGLLLTGLLAPALRWALALRLNRSLATALVLVGGLAAVGGTLTLVVNQFVADLDELVDSTEQGILQIEEWLRTGPLNMSDADLDNLIDQGQGWLDTNQETLTTGAVSAATTTFQVLTGFVLALVVTFFFLRDGRRIWEFVVGMLPAAARAPTGYAGEGAWQSLTGYVRATVLVAFIDALGIGIGLLILQVPLVLPLAALVFLGAFVPIVGAFVSGTVAVLVALVSEGGGIIKALLVLGVVLLVQQIEGNVLQPVIMSRAVKIHPLAVIVAVTSGILLAGVIGALVAVPLVAVLNTTIRRLNNFRRRPPSPAPSPSPG